MILYGKRSSSAWREWHIVIGMALEMSSIAVNSLRLSVNCASAHLIRLSTVMLSCLLISDVRYSPYYRAI